jgi:hypothetical protein
MPQNIVEISRPLRGDRSNLLVTASISRDEENRNTFDLEVWSVLIPLTVAIPYLRVFVHHPLPVEINGIFACKTRVLRIKVSELRK